MPTGVYIRTEKNKKALSVSHKGQLPWNTNKHLSTEIRNIISKSLKGRISPNKGKSLSEEHRKNIGIGNKNKVRSLEFRNNLSRKYRGKNSYLWKGGITSINQAIRHSLEYRLWRESVFKRDNYTCIWCGARNGNGKAIMLHSDHIKPFAFYPELRFAIDNGRTLCEDCHKTTDTYKQKGPICA